MFQNLFKTAWRSIRKDGWYSLLNLIGLTAGIMASLMIFLFVKNELSYDKFHEKSDRVFRIISHIAEKDDAFTWASSQRPLGVQLKMDYPEVEDFVRIQDVGQWMLQSETEKYYEDGIFIADSSFFRLFTHRFLVGDPNTCLNAPNSLVLTESLAKKYFGDYSGTDLELVDEDGDTYKITAIIEDVPDETHLMFDGLVSRSTLEEDDIGSWGSFYLYNYIMLKPNTDWVSFSQKLPEVVEKYVDPIFKQFGISVVYEMQPLGDIYLMSKTKGENEGGDMSYIYIFLTVGLFILVLASINYMNLATSRAEKRSKEVGIRKVLGSYRSALVSQFMAESILMTLVSLFVALILIAFVLLTPFNQLSGKNFELMDLFQADLIIGYVVLVLGIGILSGSYPSFFLSSFQPAWVLKGTMAQKVGGLSVRKVLVVFQFVISIGMVVSTWVVNDQLDFLRDKDLGFDKDQIIVVSLSERSMIEKVPVLRDYWLENPGIQEVGTGTSGPGGGYGKNLMDVESKDGFVEKGVNMFFVDDRFLDALGIELVLGRNFDENLKTDSNSVIVNELMVQRMDWDDPIGKRIRLGVDEDDEMTTVIGVVGNFHMLSLYEEMEDIAMFYRPRNGEMHVRFDQEKVNDVVPQLEEGWQKVFPEIPMDHYFLDQDFYEAYEKDETRSRVFLVFSVLAVLIACLGLLGLSSFSVERRSKEIGIRKIVGATSLQIVGLITKDFFLLVTIAMVIAFSISGYMMKQWLEDTFTYHTEIKLLTFFLAALVSYLLVIITVAYHSYKASITDPVEVIKDE